MRTLTTTIRRLTFGVLLTAAVVLGVVAQAGSALLALPSPAAERPDPTDEPAAFGARTPGPYAVGMRRFTAEEAPLPLSIWYPAVLGPDERPASRYSYGVSMFGSDSSITLATYPGRAAAGAEPDLEHGPYPIVVLSPGFALATSSYAWLAEHLASHGLVVASPQHAESLDPRTLWRATADRPQDVNAVLAHLEAEGLPGGELGGLIDTDRDGLWPSWGVHDVDAVVALAGDAVMFGADGLAEIGLVGAEHLLFAGGCDSPRTILRLVPTSFCSDPTWTRERAHDLVAHYTTAFLVAELADEPGGADALRQPALSQQGVESRSVGY